jgi:hypothetical protein
MGIRLSRSGGGPLSLGSGTGGNEAKSGVLFAWTRSYKKYDKLLLNVTGTLSRCLKEKVLMGTQKRELESPL